MLMASVLLLLAFGDSDFSRVKLTGPFQVGHRDIRTKFGNEVSVYYPVDKEVYKRMLRRSTNSDWLRHGDKSLQGIARASVPYGEEKHKSIRWFRFLRFIKMNTLERGPLSSLFY